MHMLYQLSYCSKSHRAVQFLGKTVYLDTKYRLEYWSQKYNGFKNGVKFF